MIGSYNQTPLTGQRQGTNPAVTRTPCYSKYEVKVTYPLAALPLSYDSPLEGNENYFLLNNAAVFKHRFAGNSP